MDLADDVGQAIVAERRPARLYDLRAPSLWLGARALVAVGTWIRNRPQPVHPGPDLVNRPTPEWSAEWQGEIAGLGDPGAAPVRLRIRIGAARSLLEVVRRDRPLCTAAVAVEVVERHARIWTEGDIPCADGTRLSSLAFFWTGACIHIDQANYDGNVDYNGCGARTDVDRERTVAVGSLPPNPWGLHEVAGNVWEWVQDAYHRVFASRDNGKNRRNGCSGIASNPSRR